MSTIGLSETIVRTWEARVFGYVTREYREYARSDGKHFIMCRNVSRRGDVDEWSCIGFADDDGKYHLAAIHQVEGAP